jgi:hypothetical protein
LIDPGGFARDVVHHLKAWAFDVLSWLALLVGTAVVCLVAAKLFVAWRARLVGREARLIRILPPPQVDPQRARQLWMALHALLRPWWRRLLSGQPRLAWEVSGRPEEVELAVWVPRVVPPGLVERAVEVAFPGSRAEAADADAMAALRRAPGYVEVTELALAEPEWYPIGGAPGDDLLGLALASVAGLGDDEHAAIQVVAQPATSRSRYHLRRAARVLRAGGHPGIASWRTGRGRQAQRPAPDPSLETDVRAVLAKASSPLWQCVLRVAVASPRRELARGRIHALAGSYALFEGRNGFRRRRARGGLRALSGRRLSNPYLLSVPELAQIATLPAAGAVAGLERAGARTVPPPRALAATGRVLGTADHSSIVRPVAISVGAARHHIHMIGETGTGKSTLLAQLVLQDAAARRAAIVIDPKGDLVETIIQRLPAGAEERTCLIDPGDREWAVGLNVLDGDDEDRVVDHVVSAFRRIFEQHWGPRTDHIMRAACLALKQIPGATIAEVPSLLMNYEPRRAIRERIKSNPFLAGFWEIYERMPENQRQQNIAPLLNKLGQFMLRGDVRAIIGQSHPKLDIEELIDSGGLLLVRIPKGTLGDETSRLLGAFVVARVWQASLRRAARPEEERGDAALYVDEMHNYLALPKSFEDLLAEARGYRLSLVLAHQHLGQLPREMRDALAANARTKIVFACSPDDAYVLEKQFRPTLTDHDLANLGAYQAACRPSLGAGHGAAFTFRTLPLKDGSAGRAAEVRATSAARFAELRAKVDQEINQREGRLFSREPRIRSGAQPRVQQGDQPADQPGVHHRSAREDPVEHA